MDRTTDNFAQDNAYEGREDTVNFDVARDVDRDKLRSAAGVPRDPMKPRLAGPKMPRPASRYEGGRGR